MSSYNDFEPYTSILPELRTFCPKSGKVSYHPKRYLVLTFFGPIEIPIDLPLLKINEILENFYKKKIREYNMNNN
tara:strand:+ start:4221 stop:4445 length:225 start_codon:yes stop_codon:yes gene_type:complete